MSVLSGMNVSGDESGAAVFEAAGRREGAGPSPTVSVIIPAYKIAPFVGETLDSVFAQTFKDYEVIVVNDGSPDTEEFERALAPYGARVRYFRQENLGAGAARNRGLREARGEFVAFLDGDDLWLPSYLEEQIRFIRREGHDLVYTDALLFGDSPLAGRTYMETAPSEGPVTFLSLVRNECNVITSGVVARRQAVLDAGLFDESLRNAQDFELWVRLARKGARLAYQRKVLVRYRYHEGSLSGDVLNRVRREWRVTKRIADTYELTEQERAELERMLERQEATIELESGRAHLLGERFEEARASFEKASRVLPGWKLRAGLLLLRVAPRLLLRLARRRASEGDGRGEGVSGYDQYVRREWEMFEGDAERWRASLAAVGGASVERVLDVGCGAGQELLPFVLERGASGVGVDVSPEAGKAGRELFAARAPEARVAFMRAAAEALPFASGAFDVVICRLALPYTDNARALSEMARVLGAGGLLILKIHHPRYYLSEAARAARSLSPLTFIHAARVLAAGSLYRITGRQPRTPLISTETFQTEAMLRRELTRHGLKIRGELADSNPQTPSYVIEKEEA